jgi:carbon monoxide dehydrogenase subunit G
MSSKWQTLKEIKTLSGHIPTLKSANWAASEIFAEFMLMVSKVVRAIRTNVSSIKQNEWGRKERAKAYKR